MSIEIADLGLDEAGRMELAHIVSLSDSFRLGALQQITNLARRYPQSAHVLLTKTLLEADVLLRAGRGSVSALVSRLEAVADFDPGYVPSHHWLCSARVASCCRWEMLDREGREAFVDVHLPPMMTALAERRFDILGDYVLSHEHALLIDNWRVPCCDAVRAYDVALRGLDHGRYTVAQLEPFTRTADVLSSGTDVLRARTVAVRWLEIWLPRVQEGFPPEVWPARYA